MPQPDPQITVHISTCAPRSDREKWGDTAYAAALADAIRGHGHQARLFFSGEAPRLTGAGDVVLRITGPHLDDTVPGVPNMAWLISMPGYVSWRALARFQAVMIASRALGERYAMDGLPASYLAQATDPDQFHPDRRIKGEPLLPVVFVGNHGPRAPRRLIKAVAGLPGIDLSVWGDGWKGEIPARFIRATHLPYAELPALYARSRIILNSHMIHMAQLGMMSNRSFDALAAGAKVLSDRVQGFAAPDLPDLVQIDDLSRLEEWLHSALAAPPDDLPTRLRRNAQIRQGYSFSARAAEILARAAQLLARGDIVPPPFAPVAAGPVARPDAPPVKVTLRDDGHPDNLLRPQDEIAALDAALAAGPVHLEMRLSDPASMPGMDNTALAALRAALAVRRILAVVARRPVLAGLSISHDPEGKADAIIHPMMQDLRRAQALIAASQTDTAMAGALALRAQRVIDQFLSTAPTGPILMPRRLSDADLVGIMHNQPLYRRDGPGTDLDRLKAHVALWPRRTAPAPLPPVGVFLHLYYPELAPVFAERLARLGVAHRIHVSTDTEDKAAAIAPHLPEARIHVLPNRGRDIAPKLYGLREAYAGHDIVLHLHGKRSAHAKRLDGWMEHVLDCLLPAPDQINRLLSFFKDVDRIGLIAPQGYRPVLRASHWAHDRDIAEELHHRLNLPAPLPDNAGLNFPAGSMFWARTAALRPLLDLPLSVANFPPEAQQIDGTLAHAIERMIGVVCQQAGFDMIRVAAADNRNFPKQRLSPRSNAELRDWLNGAVQTRRNEA